MPGDPEIIVPIGKANIVSSGTDVTIVTFSIMVGKALEAASQLANEGIDAEVIDLRTIRPIDEETIIKSVAKTNRIVVVLFSFSCICNSCQLACGKSFAALDGNNGVKEFGMFDLLLLCAW